MALCPACVSKTTGLATVAAGLGLIGLGLGARADVKRSLARERITSPGSGDPPEAPVVDAAGARSLAETIRESTLRAADGKTYAEVPGFVDTEGRPTSDRALAATDPLTGVPLDNPQATLWLTSTTLQSALMQVYLAQRLAELMAGLGAVLVGVGVGLTAASRR